MKLLCEVADKYRYQHVWMDEDTNYGGLDDTIRISGDIYPYVGYIFKMDGVMYVIESDDLNDGNKDDRFKKIYVCKEIDSIDEFTTDDGSLYR